MSRWQMGSPEREINSPIPIAPDSLACDGDETSGSDANGGPFKLLFPPYFLLEEEEEPDPYDSDGQPIDFEEYLPPNIKTRAREKRGAYVPVNLDKRDCLDPVKNLVYLGYAEDWKLPCIERDNEPKRFSSPPVSLFNLDYPERVIEADEDGVIIQPPLAIYDNIPEILSIKKVQYNLHELIPPLEGILLESEKGALHHFWKLLMDSLRKRLEDAIKCPICDEGARFGTEVYMTAFIDEQKPALASQHIMSCYVYNELGYSTLDQLVDISNINLVATDPLQWVKSKVPKLHAIEDTYWKEELLAKNCPGKRESTAPRRRNLAGDYFGFNLRKDREQKRDDFRKRVASATGITNPDLKKRRKTVRAFDADGKGVGKGQYIIEGKYVRKKQNATGDSDDHDTEDHVTQLERNGKGKGADRGSETELSANLRRISEHNSLEADVEMDDGNINTIAGNLKESTQVAEAYDGTNNTEVVNIIGSDLDIKMEDDDHELTENENGRRWIWDE